MSKHLGIAAAGLVFGFGLALSGMTHASKVLAFLDVTGAWDPSLLLVLGGAVGVTIVSFRLVLRRTAPIFDGKFHLPTAQDVDVPLVLGAVTFGVGWGISGYCPGPGIALLAAPSWETWTFVPAVLLGMFLHRTLTASDRDTSSDTPGSQGSSA